MGADLASTPLADALTSKGFDPAKRTLFTCEGIFCYLPQVLPPLPVLISSVCSCHYLRSGHSQLRSVYA